MERTVLSSVEENTFAKLVFVENSPCLLVCTASLRLQLYKTDAERTRLIDTNLLQFVEGFRFADLQFFLTEKHFFVLSFGPLQRRSFIFSLSEKKVTLIGQLEGIVVSLKHNAEPCSADGLFVLQLADGKLACLFGRPKIEPFFSTVKTSLCKKEVAAVLSSKTCQYSKRVLVIRVDGTLEEWRLSLSHKEWAFCAEIETGVSEVECCQVLAGNRLGPDFILLSKANSAFLFQLGEELASCSDASNGPVWHKDFFKSSQTVDENDFFEEQVKGTAKQPDYVVAVRTTETGFVLGLDSGTSESIVVA